MVDIGSLVSNRLKTIHERIINIENILASLSKKLDNEWCYDDIPGKNLNWVLVKICDADGDGRVYDLPHIAEFRNGEWWSLELHVPYESEEMPFKVVCWRRIPE